MSLEAAIGELVRQISAASPSAVIRVTRVSDEEASLSAYAPASDEAAIKTATQEYTLQLLIGEGLDVQVLVYDLATSLPPEE